MSLLNEPLQFAGAVRPALVTLVGAGPGDPDLLTLKAAKALRAADLVLYDHLVGKEVLELLPHSADRIYVGKESGHHTLEQDAIIDLLVRLARSGRPVLRLKGGDPYIFGRGGEEAQALAAHGIPFVVIPGISAAQGAAACAGIPLTHRDHAATLVFATGHLRSRGDERVVDLDWPMLARPRQTVVIYMGVGALPVICEQLIRHGMSPDTPAAIVEQATQPQQRTIAGSLETLPTLALLHGVKPPALIMIGAVVAMHDLLGAAAGARSQPSLTMVQGTPKRSVTMPIRDAKKVEVSGIVT
ncbi:MAG: uroporphyrinogen-III C-methyltransferase [Caldimonas sp.]